MRKNISLSKRTIAAIYHKAAILHTIHCVCVATIFIDLLIKMVSALDQYKQEYRDNWYSLVTQSLFQRNAYTLASGKSGQCSCTRVITTHPTAVSIVQTSITFNFFSYYSCSSVKRRRHPKGPTIAIISSTLPTQHEVSQERNHGSFRSSSAGCR